jgi:hypothetical protein
VKVNHALNYCLGGSGLAVEGQPDHVRRLIEQAQKSSASGAAPPAGASGKKITLYKNGFIIDDGEFRDISIEQNKKFMDTLTAGHVPPEVRLCFSSPICMSYCCN